MLRRFFRRPRPIATLRRLLPSQMTEAELIRLLRHEARAFGYRGPDA